MSELKELVKKFIEIDDDLNEKIEAALSESEELDDTFSFHNRHSSLRADITKTENCGTVCYDCTKIPATGKFI